MAANRPNDLSPEQEQAILALLDQPTVTKAAQACGTGLRTLYRWLDEPGFGAAYRKARREAFAHAIALSQKYAPAALQVLIKIAHDEAKPCAARVSAATAVLKFSRESLELDDLAARLEAVEAKVDQPPAMALHAA
jgi:hypothetical protein